MKYDMEVEVEVNGRRLKFFAAPRTHWVAEKMSKGVGA